MMATDLLRLEISVQKQEIHLGEPCQVLVKLSNKGQKPQIVNRRMAVGYRDNISREIFVDLINLHTGEPARIDAVDYNRNFSPASDYIYLQPGETISTSFDLFEWYSPVYDGTYKLIVYYQADESMATAAPPNVVSGVIKSNQIILTITKR